VSQNKKSDDLLGYTVSDKPDPTVICHVAHEAVFFLLNYWTEPEQAIWTFPHF
jgi:hypothetical protein